MTAWRYKICLLVLKIFHSFAALTHKNIFQHLKRNFVSPRGHVISSIYKFSGVVLIWGFSSSLVEPFCLIILTIMLL